MDICKLCGRELTSETQSLHHLYPKEVKQRKKIKNKEKRNKHIMVHLACHRKIHSLFSNRELFRYYNTIERILENEDIQNFIKFIKNKPLDFDAPSKLSNRRR